MTKNNDKKGNEKDKGKNMPAAQAPAPAPTDNRAAVKPRFILDNRELLHLAVSMPDNVLPNVFVLMCKKNDLLNTFVEQWAFDEDEEALDYKYAVIGMIAANYAMYPDVMDLLGDAIKRFHEAMKKMYDEGIYRVAKVK